MVYCPSSEGFGRDSTYFHFHYLLFAHSFFDLLFTGKPSTKVVILRFERGMQRGLFSRISRTATLEYHAFGIIS